MPCLTAAVLCCAVPCSARAHIPVDTYQENLQAIVQKLLSSGVERVMLMTPSPVYESAPQAIPHGEVRHTLCMEEGGGVKAYSFSLWLSLHWLLWNTLEPEAPVIAVAAP